MSLPGPTSCAYVKYRRARSASDIDHCRADAIVVVTANFDTPEYRDGKGACMEHIRPVILQEMYKTDVGGSPERPVRVYPAWGWGLHYGREREV